MRIMLQGLVAGDEFLNGLNAFFMCAGTFMLHPTGAQAAPMKQHFGAAGI